MAYPASILDGSFRYVPSKDTSVADTWRRFGWRPTTDADRQARRRLTARATVERRSDFRSSRGDIPGSDAAAPRALRAVTCAPQEGRQRQGLRQGLDRS
jgi:hypothetical protein